MDVYIIYNGGVIMQQYKGIAVSPGVCKSKARIIEDEKDFEKVESGDIIVVYRSSPGWIIPLMNAGGMICEIGGAFSHIGILCRELSKPCVSGVPDIYSIIKDNNIISIDGTLGEIQIYE